MKDLVSLEDYATNGAGRLGSKGTTNFSLVVASFAAIIVGILTPWGERGPELLRGLLFSLMYGIAFGLVFATLGVLIAPSNQFDHSQARLRRFFDADPLLVIEPPADATHRVVGALYDSDSKWMFPGALYVTSRGLVFQSNIQRWVSEGELRRPQYRSAEIGSVRTLTIGRAELLPKGVIAKVFRHKPWLMISLASEEGVIFFYCPRRDRVLKDLQLCVDELRHGTSTDHRVRMGGGQV